MFGKLLGFLSERMHRARIKYMTGVNSKSVHNDGSVISGKCALTCPKNIFIGKNSYINGGELVASEKAKIVIGNDCLISYNVFLRTDMHNYIDKNTLIREQGFTEKDIIIGNDVWIGHGAKVMAGVKIADGCVIAAGAVVTHDTEPYCVYAGVPAQKIKERIAVEQ